MLEINQVLDKFGLKFNKVLNIYLLGSRLWGTSTESSDYDLMIICRDYTGQQSLHTHNIDATVLDINEFNKRVKNYEFIETICTHLPNEFILLEKRKIRPLLSNYSQWKQTMQYRIKRDMSYVDKNESKGKLDRASKTRFHALMTLIIGIQVLKLWSGEIKQIDFTVAKEYYKTTWTKDNFVPIFNQLCEHNFNFLLSH